MESMECYEEEDSGDIEVIDKEGTRIIGKLLPHAKQSKGSTNAAKWELTIQETLTIREDTAAELLEIAKTFKQLPKETLTAWMGQL